jgi:hypothetical protein
MRTVIVSDLHLGTAIGADVLRRSELRAPLLEALRGADRLVILGDGLELREAAHRDAAGIAAPFLHEVGRALGPQGEIVMSAGNHDHGLIAGWIDARLQSERPGFLAIDQRIEPRDAGRLAGALEPLMAPARLSFAYPAIWLRDDVLAMHGHYLDLHTTVPTFERLAAGAMARWMVHLPSHGATPDDYEAALSPLYAWMHQLTQRASHDVIRAGAGASARAWVALAGDGRRRHPARAVLLGAAYATAVAGVNAAGLGPVDRSLSGAALRRGGLQGMAEVLRRLGQAPRHVVFGHTHRSGPWPGDDEQEWITPEGSRLLNTGSWVYQPHFVARSGGGSPYWPGTIVELEDEGPPRLRRLLEDRTHAELSEGMVAPRARGR